MAINICAISYILSDGIQRTIHLPVMDTRNIETVLHLFASRRKSELRAVVSIVGGIDESRPDIPNQARQD